MVCYLLHAACSLLDGLLQDLPSDIDSTDGDRVRVLPIRLRLPASASHVRAAAAAVPDLKYVSQVCHVSCPTVRLSLYCSLFHTLQKVSLCGADSALTDRQSGAFASAAAAAAT